jgi:hypothetical protein
MSTSRADMSGGSAKERFGARFDLLEGSGQISARARGLTVRFVEDVRETFGLELREDNAALFVTHVVMALSRLERGDAEAEVPAAAAGELAECEREVAFVTAFLDACSAEFGVRVPDAEVFYMSAHLCAMRE